MTCDIQSADPEGPVHRLARKPDAWAWPDWSFAGAGGKFDNRYDDPEGNYRVLYACTQRLGAFIETLARFRPDPQVLMGIAEIDGDDDGLAPGRVPADWLSQRVMGTAECRGAFADVGQSTSLTYLRQHLAARLIHYQLDDLDASTIRLKAPRDFTQEISRFIYECSEADETRQFVGITYQSRLGDEFRNWAIFEPHELREVAQREIASDDPDLLEALRRLGLTLASP